MEKATPHNLSSKRKNTTWEGSRAKLLGEGVFVCSLAPYVGTLHRRWSFFPHMPLKNACTIDVWHVYVTLTCSLFRAQCAGPCYCYCLLSYTDTFNARSQTSSFTTQRNSAEYLQKTMAFPSLRKYENKQLLMMDLVLCAQCIKGMFARPPLTHLLDDLTWQDKDESFQVDSRVQFNHWVPSTRSTVTLVTTCHLHTRPCQWLKGAHSTLKSNTPSS